MRFKDTEPHGASAYVEHALAILLSFILEKQFYGRLVSKTCRYNLDYSIKYTEKYT
jgi:hypothetical protein